MRREYEMSEAQYKALMEACKPVTYLVMGGREPTSPQENANNAWKALAVELGFIWDTVQPVYEKGDYYFTAEPVEAHHAAG